MVDQPTASITQQGVCVYKVIGAGLTWLGVVVVSACCDIPPESYSSPVYLPP